MRRLLTALAALLPAPVIAQPQTITILHTNDMHGRHAPFHVAPGDATAQTGDPGRSPSEFDRSAIVGGFQYLAGKVNEVRRREGAANVLLVDAGDTFSDDLVANETRGAAMICLMNALGYQFMALGNHDFDYGLARTRELNKIARFPMRGANTLEGGKPIFGKPWKLFQVNGVRVAMLALSYHNTGETGSRDNVRGLQFTSGIEATRRYLPQMRKAADVIVLLSHQGTAVDRKLARELPGVDLIVGGHSHDRISPPEKIGETWIAQALSDAAALGEVRLTIGKDRKLQAVSGTAHVLWNDRIESDPAMARLVADIDAPHRQKLDEVLATSADRIGRQYKSESPFDVLVGDMMRERTGADIAFMPGVGYGISIEPGPITRDRLHTLVPHPTKLVTLEMTGADVLRLLEQSATNLEPGDDLDRVGGLLQSSGIGWTLDLNAPVGRRVSDVTVARARVDPARWYKVATNAGMTGGLHRYVFVGRNQKTHDISVTQLVEDGLVKRGTIASPALGNIRLVPLVSK